MIAGTFCSVMIPCARLSLDWMSTASKVEIMVVARPMRGEEGMGAAAVGPGHRATTYTGVRGPEQPKGKGRRRERHRQRGQKPLQMRSAVYTEPAAPGVPPQIRDPRGLMGVTSTRSPDRVELPPTPPRSRHSDRRSLVVVMRSLLNPTGNLT